MGARDEVVEALATVLLDRDVGREVMEEFLASDVTTDSLCEDIKVPAGVETVEAKMVWLPDCELGVGDSNVLDEVCRTSLLEVCDSTILLEVGGPSALEV